MVTARVHQHKKEAHTSNEEAHPRPRGHRRRGRRGSWPCPPADVSNNGTTNDAYGYCIANHIANFNQGFNGIGHLRSAMTGQEISASAGNRAPAQDCVDTQGHYAPISNNG